MLLQFGSHCCLALVALSLQGDWEYCSEHCLKKSHSAQHRDEDDLNEELQKIYEERVGGVLL